MVGIFVSLVLCELLLEDWCEDFCGGFDLIGYCVGVLLWFFVSYS